MRDYLSEKKRLRNFKNFGKKVRSKWEWWSTKSLHEFK